LIEFIDIYPASRVSITASIQAFEYTYELFWKTLRKIIIDIYGVSDVGASPRTVFQKAYELHLITDLPFWLECLNKRNATAHTYEDDVAEEIYHFLPLFADNVQQAIVLLKQKVS
jgi:nucleotidyltransferase substrate binding protein (TIGR01987 family)